MTQTPQTVPVAFLQAHTCSSLPASWRHPAAASGFTGAGCCRRIGRTLEDGYLRLAFFDDRLAMPGTCADDVRVTAHEGIRAVKLDPVPCGMALAMLPGRQRRGVLRTRHEGTALHGNLGIPRPVVGVPGSAAGGW